MTRSQIKAYVQSITEKKLVGQVDFDALLNQVLQEFCAEHRFWWRKKSLTFNTAANTSTYDLTTITTVPAGSGVYVEEITRLYYIDSSANIHEVTAVTDDEGVMTVIADTTTKDIPGTWSPDPNDLTLFQTIRIGPIPNGTYSMRAFFWAMPNPDQESSDDAIYIVPKPLHHVVVTGMEKEVWRLTYGEQDPKYITALNLYNKKVEMARLKPSFWSGKSQTFANQSGEAIRSTR
jgi:hypothetical protein